MASNLKQKTVSGFVYKMLERIGAQGVNFIVSIVLARILLPEEYGVIALVTVFITILDVFVTYGFGNSLIAYKDSDDVDFSTCLYFGLVLAVVVYILVYFSSPALARYYNNELLIAVVRVMALRIPIASVNTVQHAYVSKHMMFKKFFISTSIGTVLSGTVAIVMAYKGFGVWALVEQYLGNVACDTICLGLIIRWRPILAFSFKKLKRIYNYGWKILAVGLLDNGYNQLRNLVIGKKYSSADLAYYNKGFQFPQMATSIIEPTIVGVMFPSLSQCNDNIPEMRSISRRIIKTSTYLVFPIMVGLIVVAKPLIDIVLTPKWESSIIFLQIACLAQMFRPVQYINTSIIQAMKKSGLLLTLDLIKKGVGVLLLVLSIRFGVMGIAVSLVFSNLFSTFINILPNRKLLAYGYRMQFKDILENFIIALIMGGITYLISFTRINQYILLFLQIIAGIILYIGLSVVFKNESFFYLLDQVKKYLKKRKVHRA